MNKYIFILLILLNFQASTQNFAIYDSINKIPESELKSIASLTAYIEKSTDSEMEKARAAFYWITNNIKYDVKKYFKDKSSNYEPDLVFEKKKALCAGYSNLFRYMCSQMNIKSEIVIGYTFDGKYKKGEQLNEANHAWNAFYAESKWHLLDATWGSGYIKRSLFSKKFQKSFDGKYFDLPPHFFILNHLPEVPMWQLLNYPIILKTFSLPDGGIDKFLEKKKVPYFNFNDTIQLLYSKDNDQMSIDYGKMALEFNSNNKTPLAFAMLHIVQNNMMSSLSDITMIDSLITLTENSLFLMNKAKSSRKSVIETIEINIRFGNQILAELNQYKAAYFEKEIKNYINLPFDSLKFIVKQITETTSKTFSIYKSFNNSNAIAKAENDFCQMTLDIFNIFQNFFELEQDLKNKRKIKKELSKLLLTSKKLISDRCECKQYINMIKMSEFKF